LVTKDNDIALTLCQRERGFADSLGEL